jgi:hypothetical protein
VVVRRYRFPGRRSIGLIQRSMNRVEEGSIDAVVVLSSSAAPFTRSVHSLLKGCAELLPGLWVLVGDLPAKDVPGFHLTVRISARGAPRDVVAVNAALVELGAVKPIWVCGSSDTIPLLRALSTRPLVVVWEPSISTTSSGRARDVALTHMMDIAIPVDWSTAIEGIPPDADVFSWDPTESPASGAGRLLELADSVSPTVTRSHDVELGRMLLSGILVDGRVEESVNGFVRAVGADPSNSMARVARRALVRLSAESEELQPEASSIDATVIATLQRTGRMADLPTRMDVLDRLRPLVADASKTVQVQWTLARTTFPWSPWPGDLLPLLDRTAMEFGWDDDAGGAFVDVVRGRYETSGRLRPTTWRRIARRMRPAVIPAAKRLDRFLLRLRLHRLRRIVLGLGRRLFQK